MEIKEIGNTIRHEIEDQYGSITNFCEKNKITYMPFTNKLAGIRKGKDFRFAPINKIANILGYELVLVKK